MADCAASVTPDGHLFLAMGERFLFVPAQDRSNHVGTVIRIERDGSVPTDEMNVPEAGRIHGGRR